MSDTTTTDALDVSLHHLKQEEYPTLLTLSERLRQFVDWVGRFGSWFIIPLVLITAFDVTLRKTGKMQIWMVENISWLFGSTILQEMEWHLHTVVFCMVLGLSLIHI